MALLGSLLGIDQAKLIEALAAELKKVTGGASLAETLDKYGDTHRLRARVGIVDNKLEAEVWLEEITP